MIEFYIFAISDIITWIMIFGLNRWTRHRASPPRKPKELPRRSPLEIWAGNPFGVPLDELIREAEAEAVRLHRQVFPDEEDPVAKFIASQLTPNEVRARENLPPLPDQAGAWLTIPGGGTMLFRTPGAVVVRVAEAQGNLLAMDQGRLFPVEAKGELVAAMREMDKYHSEFGDADKMLWKVSLRTLDRTLDRNNGLL